MAHPQEKRDDLRKAYVFGNLSMEIAALQVGVAIGTARRWKRDALDRGDDWDRSRDAHLLSGGGIESVSRSLLSNFIIQYQSTLEMLNDNTDIKPLERVQAIASLSDSFTKAVSASKKVLPETNRLAIVLEVIQLLIDFINTQHAEHMPAFVEILDGFGQKVEEEFGK